MGWQKWSTSQLNTAVNRRQDRRLAPRRFFSLLRNDEALVLCADLTVAANTPVDMNMTRFQVPSDKRLITLLNYSLIFF